MINKIESQTIREIDKRLKRVESVIYSLSQDDLEDLVDSRILSQKIKSSQKDFVDFKDLKNALSDQNSYYATS